MRKTLLALLMSACVCSAQFDCLWSLGLSAATEDRFISTWTVPADGLITIPLIGVGINGTCTIAGIMDEAVFTSADKSAITDIDVSSLGAAGTEFQVYLSGTVKRIYFNNGGDKASFISVDNLGSVGWVHFENAFYGCANMTGFTAGDCDTGTTTDLTYMFRNCYALADVDLTGWDTSNIQIFERMFFDCIGFSEIVGIEDIDTSSATSLYAMFNQNWGLTSIDLSSWDTSNVTTIQKMFFNCDLLTNINITGWNLNSLNDPTYFVFLTPLTSASYNSILAQWRSEHEAGRLASSLSTQEMTPNVATGQGVTDKTYMTDTALWTIIDSTP